MDAKDNFVVMWMNLSWVKGERKKFWAASELILTDESRDLLGALQPGWIKRVTTAGIYPKWFKIPGRAAS